MLMSGDSKAAVNINITRTILSGQPTNGSCVASGAIYSRISQYFYIRVRLIDNANPGDCSIKPIGKFQNLRHAHYQQNFSITCNNGNNSVGIQCFTHANDDTTQTYIQGTITELSRLQFACIATYQLSNLKLSRNPVT